MNAGRLDRRVTIEAKDNSIRFDDNGPNVGWIERAVVWANVKHTGGTESDEGKQMVQKNSAEFTIRYISTIETTDRILFEGNYYHITSINEIGRRNGLKLKATWRDNNG